MSGQRCVVGVRGWRVAGRSACQRARGVARRVGRGYLNFGRLVGGVYDFNGFLSVAWVEKWVKQAAREREQGTVLGEAERGKMASVKNKERSGK